MTVHMSVMLHELFILNWHRATFVLSLLFQFIKVFGWITLVSETCPYLAGFGEVFLPAALQTPGKQAHGTLVVSVSPSPATVPCTKQCLTSSSTSE